VPAARPIGALPLALPHACLPLRGPADYDLSPFGVVGNSGWNACFLNNFLGR
jgi:hypothetical protein